MDRVNHNFQILEKSRRIWLDLCPGKDKKNQITSTIKTNSCTTNWYKSKNNLLKSSHKFDYYQPKASKTHTEKSKSSSNWLHQDHNPKLQTENPVFQIWFKILKERNQGWICHMFLKTLRGKIIKRIGTVPIRKAEKFPKNLFLNGGKIGSHLLEYSQMSNKLIIWKSRSKIINLSGVKMM